MGQRGSRFIGTASLQTTSQRRFISSLNVANMNANGPGKAAMRRKAIGGFLKTHDPSIVFFQEFTKRGPLTNAWQEFDLTESFKYVGDTEASLLYNEDKVQMLPLKMESEALLQKHGFIKDRLLVTVLEDNEDKDKFITASWHGPHSGFTTEMKEDTFVQLLKLLTEIAKIEKLRLIIGGDFNLDMGVSKRLIPKHYMLYDYNPIIRKGKPVIDYFIASNDLLLEDVDAYPMGDDSVLDHDVGTGTLKDPEQ